MNSETLRKFNLNGAVALITGGAGRLGMQHARAILDGGGEPILLDIDTTRIKTAQKQLSEIYGRKIFGFKLDITNEKEIVKTLKKITDTVGKIEILINNAANNPTVDKKSGPNLQRLENFSLKRWKEDLDVGLGGAFLMSKYVGQQMAKNKKGVILNIASDLAVIAPDQRLYKKIGLTDGEQPVKPVTYSVAKHGLLGLTKYLATYWADKGIRVNSVSPGGVYSAGMPRDFLTKISNLIPMGRMAREDEYKGVVLFLCSDASAYMTGANIVIDGGRTVW